MMAPPTNEERPAKKAKSEELNKENTTNKEDVEKVVCFRITNVESHNKFGKDGLLSLCTQSHGLYHLVNAVFDTSLNELSGGDSIYSHLWKVKFGEKQYDSMLLCPEFGSVVCDEQNPRLLHTFNPTKGMKGSFGGESGEFKFVVESVRDKLPNDALPKYEPIAAPVITMAKDSSYISNEQKQEAERMRASYEAYYNGMNDWKRQERRDTQEVYVPCKPMSPHWSHKENTVIGLFLKGGWKFKQSWKCGLQYAFLHRAETATSGHWYQLRGTKSYCIENVGRGMTPDQMIIQAKKLCKSMMEATLSKGAPTRRPKPKTFAETMDLARQNPESYDKLMFERTMRRNHSTTFEF